MGCTLQLDRDATMLQHIEIVYNTFIDDLHSLKHENIVWRDYQNWMSTHIICAPKVKNCFKLLYLILDVHNELILETKMYLEICSDYINIFLSPRLDLKLRVVKAGKVSWFFCLWSFDSSIETMQS